MKAYNKIIWSLVGITTSIIITPLIIYSNNNQVINQEKLLISKNSRNRYLINLKTASNLTYTESSNLNYLDKKNLLALDARYVEAYGPTSSSEAQNRLALNLKELNKYGVGEQEFLKSLSFELTGSFFETKDMNKIKKQYFDKPFIKGDGGVIPTNEIMIQNYYAASPSQKYISLLLDHEYNKETSMLYITPQIKATNNNFDDIDNPLYYNFPPNQNIFLSISSPFIWEDDGVVLDEFISSEFKLNFTNSKITISSQPGSVANSTSEFSFSDPNSGTGTLINKLPPTDLEKKQPILIDLRNIYYDDQASNGKSFDVIFNNFKIESLIEGVNNYELNSNFFPITFNITEDTNLPIDSLITKSHYFFQDVNNGFLKLDFVLVKEDNLVYRIQDLNFSSNAGSADIKYSITLDLNQSDYISTIIKPSNFSSLNAKSEIDKINNSNIEVAIPSNYSSDIFDDSKIDVNGDQNIQSNYSKVKKDLNEKLANLFTTPTFQAMGASLDTFNYPVYSYEYRNPNDFSSGYGTIKIAANTPNHFLDRVELKILYQVDKTGSDEVVQISLKKESNGNETLLAKEAEKFSDLNEFIFFLNNQPLSLKLTYFDIRSTINTIPASVIVEEGIVFNKYISEGIEQNGAISITVPLETNYNVVVDNVLKSEITIFLNDLKLVYPPKQQSDITINHEKLATIAGGFSTYETFLQSEGSKVREYINTNNPNQIISIAFAKNPLDANIINIIIKIHDSFIFDNFKQEKTFSVGNIVWDGQVENIKNVSLDIKYDWIANYALTKKDAPTFITEFNKNSLTNISNLLTFTKSDKTAIRSIVIEPTNNLRTYYVKINLKSGFKFSDQGKNDLTKTFSIINIRFNGEEAVKFEQILLSVNPANLISYLEGYEDLSLFITQNRNNFLRPNDNSNSIINMNPYFSDAIPTINVSLNDQQAIVIKFKTTSGYYFDDYNNPNYEIIITIQNIKDYYESLNDNYNSFEVDFDIYSSLLKNDAKKYSDLDTFLTYLNTDKNIYRYIQETKGNINAIQKVELIKIPNMFNSFNLKITLKKDYYFIGSSIDNPTKTIRINNVYFMNQDVDLKNVNLELDFDLFAQEAKKFQNFVAFKDSLDTLTKKLKFFIFTSGNQEGINTIDLETLADPHSIKISITLKEGFVWSNQPLDTKEIIVNNIYYQDEINPDLKEVDISINGNALLAFIKGFPNFQSLSLILNNKEELLKFVIFNGSDSSSIESIFIYKGTYWNDFYIQIILKNNYYFKGESQFKSYQNILISNVRYSDDNKEPLNEINIWLDFDFLFELFNDFDLSNFVNFSNENYKYLLNFHNNNSIIQLSSLNAKLVQSAIMYNDSTGFYFELKFIDGVFWNKDDQSNPYYKRRISFDELKIEHQNYLVRLSAINAERQNTILIISTVVPISVISIIGTIVIIKVIKNRRRKRREE